MLLKIIEAEASTVVELIDGEQTHRHSVAGPLPSESLDGREFGQWLFDESLSGAALRERLATADAGALQVQVCARRPAFFAPRWEALIVPGDEHMLALRCAGFQRRYGQAPVAETHAARNTGRGDLRVLCIVASGDADRPADSDLYSTFVRALEFDRPVRFEPMIDPDLPSVAVALQNSQSLVDAVHIDGPCRLVDERWRLSTGAANGEGIDLHDLLARIAAADVPLVVLGLECGPVDDHEVLARLAAEAPTLTLIGYTRTVDAGARADDALSLYRHLAAGATVARAVLETRALRPEALQTTPETATSEVPASLVQYGDTCPRFFEPSQASDIDRVLAQPYGRVRSRLFGFHGAMLPPECQWSSSRALWALLGQSASSRVLWIEGEPGAGKTHLAHQLAFYHCLQDGDSFAFYFDYGDAFYDARDIAQMIAPVLGIDNADPQRFEVELAKRPCHFVVDALPGPDTEGLDAAAYVATTQLLRNLASRHRVTFVGGSDAGCTARPIRRLEFAPRELEAIATESCAKLGVAKHTPPSELTGLLRACGGSPWQIKKSLARLITRTPAEAMDELAAAAVGDADRIARYFDVQFERLPVHWRKLLGAMLDFPGVYFQVLTIAPDRSDGEVPSASGAFMQALGAGDVALSSAIPELESAGFLQRSGLGHLIEQSARRYLLRRIGDLRAGEVASLAQSRLLCESVCAIAPRLQSSENQILAYQIVGNRHHWARCMEQLWRARMFDLFFATRHQLQQLLSAHRLQDEIDAWSHDLICRTDASYYDDAPNPQALAAWLTLARSSLSSRERASHPVIATAARSLFERLEAEGIAAGTTPEALARVGQLVNFLEGSYHVRGQWQQCYDVSARAYRIGEQCGQANRMMRSLKSMAKCCAQLDRLDECRILEDQLIEMTHSDALAVPQQTRLMLSLECLDDRVRRGDAAQAQRLLDRLAATQPEPPVARLLERYQADIYFAQERFEESAGLYGGLKRNSQPNEPAAAAAHIDARLDALKQKLDSATFHRLCGSESHASVSRTVH